jgi:glycine betaine/proline transport system substrate-binding protein
MTHPIRRRAGLAVALVSSAALALSACGGGDIASSDDGGSGSASCDSTVNMAINPWVGFEASAHVVGRVIEDKLGCKVDYKNLKEEVSWQGFGNDVDVVIEDWGHPDLVKKYVDSANPTAVEVGPNGNVGQIGWFVPPWMVEKYPDILDYKNLNKYADMFKTSESGNQGQLLDGDPSFVTNDEALVKNNDLNYKVVYAGSEAALITAFRQAEEKKTPLIGYFFEPQWLHLDIELVKVDLPPYTAGCDADAVKVACDYPRYELDKIAAKKFMDKRGPAARLIENFQWSNDEQDTVASFIAKYKMSPDEAAKRWVEANPDRVEDWLTKAKP